MTTALQTFVPGRHAYVPNPWNKPECDAKVDVVHGQVRLCAEAPAAAVHRLPFIVGENNPYGSDPRFAMYCSPENSAGGRLQRLVLQIPRAQYLREFHRRNLLQQPKWSVIDARAAAVKLSEEIGDSKVILLGAKVCAGFRLDFQPFTIVRGRVAILPHPSGLCRMWSEPGAYDRGRDLVRELLGTT